MTIVQIVSINTFCLRSKWQASYTFSVQNVWRTSQDPALKFYWTAFLLCRKLCFANKHVHMQKRQTRTWKHVQTRHSWCICGSMDMRERKERKLGQISSTFKAFEIGLLNFKGFQDAYELRSENMWINYLLLLNLMKPTTCKTVRLCGIQSSFYVYINMYLCYIVAWPAWQA